MYEIIVGNIGSVFYGTNGFEAYARFQAYCGLSKANYGRASGEDVILCRNGEIVKEYIGTLSKAEA